MALKDRLDEALQATPPENAARRATLAAIQAASGSGSDAEIQNAIATLIGVREQQAASFAAAGQTELAKAERAEIDALRALLRFAAPPPGASSAKPATPAKAKKTPATPEAKEPQPRPPRINQKQMIIGLALLAAVAVAAFFVIRATTGAKQAANGSSEIVLRADDFTMGDPKAPVVLLEYAAPTCPHCAHMTLTLIPKVKETFIDKGKVFFIYRPFPLNSTDFAVEAIARKCLPADKYFQFLDLMFRNQPKWDPDGYVIPDVGAAVKQMARIMGITPDQADQCMTDREELNRIDSIRNDAIARYQISSTPTLILDGVKLEGAERTWPGLKAKIESLLAKK